MWKNFLFIFIHNEPWFKKYFDWMMVCWAHYHKNVFLKGILQNFCSTLIITFITKLWSIELRIYCQQLNFFLQPLVHSLQAPLKPWDLKGHQHELCMCRGEKPAGGEQIDTYKVIWIKSGDIICSGESQIAHVKGNTFYDMFVSNLESGQIYHLEITATNIGGSSKSNTVTVQLK